MSFWDAVFSLPSGQIVMFGVALVVAFAFEFINGFHDTANAVTTVIYTRSMKATPAVLYSGVLNCLGVLLGGWAVAFSIVNLLPVDLLVENSRIALICVMALLIGAVIWNLGTWYFGIPVSSSHTLIGSILGVGLANSLLSGSGLSGINWAQAKKVGYALLCSPLIGFIGAFVLLKILKVLVPAKRFYQPPEGDDTPPLWIRSILIFTCGGVSFFHGSNDGQKGMGLLLLVLIGFLPFHYALNIYDAKGAKQAYETLLVIQEKGERGEIKDYAKTKGHVEKAISMTAGKQALSEVPDEERWELRKSLYQVRKAKIGDTEIGKTDDGKALTLAIEFVPFWVVLGTALALGIGTTVGYKRIVVTVAEKIGKSHLSYAQGASAETVAAVTIFGAVFYSLPVSTTQILSSGVAGTMVANRSGVQSKTITRILLAWLFTLPSTMLLSGLLFAVAKSVLL